MAKIVLYQVKGTAANPDGPIYANPDFGRIDRLNPDTQVTPGRAAGLLGISLGEVKELVTGGQLKRANPDGKGINVGHLQEFVDTKVNPVEFSGSERGDDEEDDDEDLAVVVGPADRLLDWVGRFFGLGAEGEDEGEGEDEDEDEDEEDRPSRKRS